MAFSKHNIEIEPVPQVLTTYSGSDLNPVRSGKSYSEVELRYDRSHTSERGGIALLGV
jgi:hypothetical protein